MFRLVEVFEEQSERDKQRLVGASNISNPCTRCLADDMLGVTHQSKYVMGAKIGTAIHAYIEDYILRNHPEMEPETKVTLGEIEGYGVIRSTSDLYIPAEKRVCDWKTTTSQKIDRLARDLSNAEWLLAYPDEALAQGSGTALKYVVQTHLYAWGLEQMGKDVERITIGMIPRDATTLKDLVERTYTYNPRVPEVWFNRAAELWYWMEDGGDPETLPSAAGCYICDNVR